MSISAKLRVLLQADDTVVADVADAVLWQKVLLAINRGGGEHFQVDGEAEVEESGEGSSAAGLAASGGAGKSTSKGRGEADALHKFAEELSVSREVVEGACAPSTEEPYLYLDVNCWEEMKRQTPARGPKSHSAIVVAATLLVLWFRAASLGNTVSTSQAAAVLETVNVRDRNASRGIQHCEWLQGRRNGSIVLNPAQASRARSIARSFCTKQWDSRD